VASVTAARERAARTREEVERHAGAAARAVADRVDGRVTQMGNVLATVAHAVRPGSSSADIAHNDSVLAAIKRDLPPGYLYNLWLADAQGDILGTSERPLPDRATLNAADRRYFREAVRTRRLALGDVVRGRTDTTKWSIGLARPMLDARGEVMGVVIGTLNVPALGGALDVPGLPDGAVVTLLDREAHVLARSRDAARWVGRDVGGMAGVAHVIAPDSGVVEVVGLDGVRRLSAYAWAPVSGWNVYVGIPTSAAFAEVRATVWRDAIVGAVTLAVMLVVAGTIARRITRPVGALVEDAQAIAAGDYVPRSSTELPRELAALAAAYNEMAVTIAQRTAELHSSEQRYRQLFDASPLPMYLADLSTYRVLAVNEAGLAKYGYTREQFLGLTLLDLRPPEERLRFLAVARSMEKAQLNYDRTNAGLWRHVGKDGVPFEVEVFTAVTEYEGRPARLSVASDVTARRRAERALQESQEQLRRAQKMEALGRFAGGIAHDFNNILTGILGYADLALADLPEGAPGREELAEIHAAAQRAAALTGRILAFSRGRVTQPKPVEVNGVVAELEPMLRRLIGEHILLDVALAPDLGSVLGDPGQLEQVLLNLALNARDAMPDGGTLAVSTFAADVEPDDPAHPGVGAGSHVVLEVRDTGVGMSAETQAHIFEPFFTTKERGKGTGLGLATVYGIVRQAGGAVRVESAPHRGSTFSVYLPRVSASAEERPAPPPRPESRRGSETVLLVEDEAAVRAIARATLVRHGYTVLVAADGPSALDVGRTHDGEIALLLTDVVMPGMNGRVLAECLTRDRPATAVLFMSGYTEDEVLHRGVEGERMAFVSKPFTPDALAAKVRAVLDACPRPGPGGTGPLVASAAAGPGARHEGEAAAVAVD
jgi:hypothetical protein